jgi:hypothetical protein
LADDRVHDSPVNLFNQSCFKDEQELATIHGAASQSKGDPLFALRRLWGMKE